MVASDRGHDGAGDVVEVYVSSSPGDTGVAEVFRLGHYGGAGARRVGSSDPLSLNPQPACPPQPGTALVECDWRSTTAFTIAQSWLSGVYVVRVRRGDGARAFTPFVVRDGRPAELLLQTTFTTDQAYNGWNGESLYQDRTGLMPSGRATMVSFNRPYFDASGLGRFAWRALEFVQFIERAGYDVTYATNLDFLRDGHLLDHVGALVIPGHDEYWPPEERAAASSVTNVPRSLAAGLAPLLTGVLLEKTTFGWPLVIGGTLKAIYDLALLAQFRAAPTREEGVH